MADLRISELPGLGGSGLADVDVLPITDTSASQTKKITAKDLVQYGVTLLDPGSIPTDKYNLVLAAGSVDTTEIADGGVTAIKIDDNSVAVVGAGTPVAGDFIGQLCVDTDDDKLRVWTGGAWLDVKAAGSIDTITSASTGLVNLGISATGSSVALDVDLSDTTGPKQFMAGPTTGSGAVTARPIVGGDLPLATNTQIGAVSIGSGLTASTSGVLSIDNSIAAGSVRSLVTYDAKGLVLSGSPLTGADVPDATDTTKGVVIAGPSMVVSSGQIDIANRTTAGTYTKVSVDSYGSVVTGLLLQAADIPALDVSAITTGQFGRDRLGARTVSNAEIDNYGISFIQEAMPPLNSVAIGTFWYQESTAGLHLYNGNSWMPVSIGRLSQENLRYCGTVDASTGLVEGVTTFGTAAGYKIGDSLKAATDAQTGVYFVITTAGNGISETPAVTYDNGDWALCNGNVAGWVRVDTLNGGGGGGATRLNELLDVGVASPAVGDVLEYQSSGQWLNVHALSGGTY